MKQTLYILFFFSSFLLKTNGEAFAQNEANYWYFGENAGLNFNGATPVPLMNGQINEWLIGSSRRDSESCISDEAGNLLFYTEGTRVWNKNHVQMPNGFGLNGLAGSIIIQKPGSATNYYIFTVNPVDTTLGGQWGNWDILYSEIDITLNAGLGDVTVKNAVLTTNSCIMLTSVRKCNNQDVWIVTHETNSNAFRAYSVTSAGINFTPVVSNCGTVLPGSAYSSSSWIAGERLKASPDGKKLALSISYAYAMPLVTPLELFDFDNSTGTVSNEQPLAWLSIPFGELYGLEFSSDATKLYAGHYGEIYQYNLCAGSGNAIANSGVLIGTSSDLNQTDMQLAPDNKIYVTRYGATSLGVINNPNTLGTGAYYDDEGIYLGGRYCWTDLPNFESSYFKPSPPPFTVSVNCLTGDFTMPTIIGNYCTASPNTIASLEWNFGDPASASNNTSAENNPTHIFTSAGTYQVTLVINYPCGNDSIKQNITVLPALFLSASVTDVTCNNGNNGSATVNIDCGGTPPFTYSWYPSGGVNATANNLIPGNYTVTVTDATGFSNTQNLTIPQPDSISIYTTLTSSKCNTNTGSGTATVNPTGGTPNYTFNWSNGQTTQTATGLEEDNYTILITDAKGCSQTATITINTTTDNFDAQLPNAFSPNNDGHNDVFLVQGWENCVTQFSMLIFNRWGEKVFESDNLTFGWKGDFNGTPANPDVFVCYIKATLIDEKKITKKGNISLIR